MSGAASTIFTQVLVVNVLGWVGRAPCEEGECAVKQIAAVPPINVLARPGNIPTRMGVAVAELLVGCCRSVGIVGSILEPPREL